MGIKSFIFRKRQEEEELLDARNRYQEQGGKKMREEKMIENAHRKYTSERKNSFWSDYPWHGIV